MDLLSELQETRKLMKQAMAEIPERGRIYAQAEADYQAAKNVRALELKAEHMSATLIQLTIKGDKDVNMKLFERDVALIEYESARDAVNVLKLDARLLEQQIQREWNQSGGVI